ncbi:MAG: sugar-binding domain-containing protein [Coprococcus sp.]
MYWLQYIRFIIKCLGKCLKLRYHYNPVGLYRKTFNVDDKMLEDNRRVYVNFQGVESAYYVYVNGKEVGYSEETLWTRTQKADHEMGLLTTNKG